MPTQHFLIVRFVYSTGPARGGRFVVRLLAEASRRGHPSNPHCEVYLQGTTPNMEIAKNPSCERLAAFRALIAILQRVGMPLANRGRLRVIAATLDWRLPCDL